MTTRKMHTDQIPTDADILRWARRMIREVLEDHERG